MPNMPLPQVHSLFKKRALPGAVMRTNDDGDYISDDDDVAVMFTDDTGRAYIAIGNVEDLAHSNSEVDKNKLDNCAYLNQLEKTYQSRVPVHDSDALFVLRWYDEVGRNGRIFSGYQDCRVVQYHLPLEMKESFYWYSNWQVICPVQVTKMEHQHGMYKLSGRDQKILKAELQKARGWHGLLFLCFTVCLAVFPPLVSKRKYGTCILSVDSL